MTFLKKNFPELTINRILGIAIALFLFRSAIPEFKIPFLVLYAGVVVAFIIKFRSIILQSAWDFISKFYLVIILQFFLLISFIFSNKIYLLAFKDLINSIILVSFFFLLFVLVRTVQDLKKFLKNLTDYFIVIGSLISLIYILDSFEILSYFHNESTYANFFGNSGDVTYIDYNFALIPCFFAIICIVYNLYSQNRAPVHYYVILYILSLNILLAGSRRGIFIYFLMLSGAVVTLLVLFIHKKPELKIIRKYLLFFLLFSAFNILSFCAFFYIVPPEKQNDILRSIGSSSPTIAKYKISSKFYRYYTLFNNEDIFSEWFWKFCADPKDPDSGWGYRLHKTVYTLPGDNAGILPENTKGYLLDSTSNSNYYPASDICESYTMLVALNVDSGDQYSASVFCYVSDDFDGNSVSFGNSASVIGKGLVSGIPVTNYDLSKKGEWQLLNVQFMCSEAYIPLLMSITVKGVKDFSKLNGHVIFAYPQFKKINSQGKLLFRQNCGGNKKFRLKNFDNEISSYLRNKVQTYTYPSTNQKYKLGGVYLVHSYLFNTGVMHQNQIKTDPIRRWISNFVSEDTTYYSYKSTISLDTISNPFIADRLMRWKFACEIFMKEFSWKKKLLGGGFNFLNWYGKVFMNDKTKSDYPHNPFLYILLYSGIIGILFYLVFLYKVFYYYFKYVKEYPLILVFFLITFFFTFFSSGNPFDPPLMGFFSMIPFIIHFVHKEGQVNQYKTN